MLTCQTTPINPAILAADSPDNHTPCYPCAQVPAASDSGSYLFPCWAGRQKQPLPSQPRAHGGTGKRSATARLSPPAPRHQEAPSGGTEPSLPWGSPNTSLLLLLLASCGPGASRAPSEQVLGHFSPCHRAPRDTEGGFEEVGIALSTGSSRSSSELVSEA